MGNGSEGTSLCWDASALSGAPGRMMSRFRRAHPNRVRTLRLLILDWPETQYTMRMVAAHITDGLLVKPGGQPLLHCALCAALDDYERAVIDTRPDRERLIVFLDRLFGHVIRAAGTCGLRDRRGGLWRACDGFPLGEWLVGRDAGDLVVECAESDFDDRAAARSLAALQWLALEPNIRAVLGLPEPGRA